MLVTYISLEFLPKAASPESTVCPARNAPPAHFISGEIHVSGVAGLENTYPIQSGKRKLVRNKASVDANP